jgi:hypothetical protein
MSNAGSVGSSRGNTYSCSYYYRPVELPPTPSLNKEGEQEWGIDLRILYIFHSTCPPPFPKGEIAFGIQNHVCVGFAVEGVLEPAPSPG